ncbi:MAG TPA: acyl-CoA desaturase [Flavobacteriales bacterium]|nr:acyl-CoA desaturase [Flavobacteriales bacterium]HPH81797.1 acyl-CoA desaturase [Flavobacteriales bacterium]
MTTHQRGKIKLLDYWGFIGIHFVPLLAIFTGTFAFDWYLALALYLIRMFFITAGYHRYFSHRTFKTSRVFQFILAYMAQTSMQKGALWWAANHRIHHKYSDTPADPHSAKLFGFWYAHVGWIVGPDFKETRYDLIKDMAKYPELVWLNKYHWVPAASLMVFCLFLGNYVNGAGILDFQAGVSTLLIGFFLSTAVLYHGTFTINSLMHEMGFPRYKTTDESKNSVILALVTLGEGWHNNHHYYQSTARQGFYWWEIDITYYIIRLLGFFRIVWDIREVPKHVKDGNHLKSAA